MAEHPHHPDDLVPLDDSALVQLALRCLHGGPAERETAQRCVAVVILRWRGLVRGVIAAKVPRDAVDEVESDVLRRFATKVYSGASLENPAGMLVRMARFSVASFHEGRRDGELAIEGWDGAVDDDSLTSTEVEAAVDELLAPLNERQREAVWLRIVEGRPSAEVAAMLDTTPGNIDVIVHRALVKMREAAR